MTTPLNPNLYPYQQNPHASPESDDLVIEEKKGEKKDYSSSLTKEILSKIFARLHSEDLKSVASVKREWKAVALDTIKSEQSVASQPLDTAKNEPSVVLQPLTTYEFLDELISQLKFRDYPGLALEMKALQTLHLPYGKSPQRTLQLFLQDFKKELISILMAVDALHLNTLRDHFSDLSDLPEFKDLFIIAKQLSRLRQATSILNNYKLTAFSEEIEEIISKVDINNKDTLQNAIEKIKQKLIDEHSLLVEQRFPPHIRAHALLMLGKIDAALIVMEKSNKKDENYKLILQRACLELIQLKNTKYREKALTFLATLANNYPPYDEKVLVALFEVLRKKGDIQQISKLQNAYYPATKIDAFIFPYHPVRNAARYEMCLHYLSKNAQGEVVNLEEALKNAAELRFTYQKNHVYSLIAGAYLDAGYLVKAIEATQQLEYDASSVNIVANICIRLNRALIQNKDLILAEAKLQDLQKIQIYLLEKIRDSEKRQIAAKDCEEFLRHLPSSITSQEKNDALYSLFTFYLDQDPPHFEAAIALTSSIDQPDKNLAFCSIVQAFLNTGNLTEALRYSENIRLNLKTKQEVNEIHINLFEALMASKEQFSSEELNGYLQAFSEKIKDASVKKEIQRLMKQINKN